MVGKIFDGSEVPTNHYVSCVIISAMRNLVTESLKAIDGRLLLITQKRSEHAFIIHAKPANDRIYFLAIYTVFMG